MYNKNLKTLLFSLGLAAMTLTANNLTAQNGGVFGKGTMPDAEQPRSGMFGSRSQLGYSVLTEQFGNGTTGGTYNIGTEQFGQNAPLGSGLFIMAAAGAGYALKKRKNNK